MTEQRPARTWLIAVTLALVAIQIYALYAPGPPDGPGIDGLDKVAHFALFAAPVATAVLSGADRGRVAALALIQAIVSEVFQAMFLDGRSGDPFDVLADALGVAAGLWIAAVVRGRAARR